MDSADSTLVPELNDSRGNNDEVVASPPQKVKRIAYDYSATFENEKEAEDLLKAENTWTGLRKRHTEEGNKKIYRCPKPKARGQQCSASVYLLYEAASFKVVLFRSQAGHNCDTIATKAGSTLMTEEVKRLIEELCQQHKKPQEIIDILAKANMPVPKAYQISSHISAFKKAKFGPTTLSLSELRTMLDKFAVVPNSEEVPFMVADIDYQTLNFRFFATSIALIKKAQEAKCLCADATYKLLWQGFPVLVVGTTDLNRMFHLIGIAVCRSEKEEDFEFLFESVQKSAQKLLGCDVAPSALVCDAAAAIPNAFKKVFGDDNTVVMCWAHMLKNVQKKVAALVAEKADQKAILADITFLQTIATVKQFEQARSLFLAKWESQVDFINYFMREWVAKNANWYEGAAQHTPSTNNALEATNRVLKDDVTKRERLSLSEFVAVLESTIGRYSRRCKTDQIFASVPTITKQTWIAAHHWAKSTHQLKMKTTPDGSSIISVKATTFDGDAHIVHSDWKDLNEFKFYYTSYWTVTRAKDETKWLRAICSCPVYQKQFVCKHCVGIAERMAEVKLPEDAKNMPIETKRKRGRPTKAKTAYVVQ